MTFSDIPTEKLIADYKRLESLEDSYFNLLRKYLPNTTFEPDEVFVAIKLELAKRQISGKDVKTVNINTSESITTTLETDEESVIIQRLKEKISSYDAPDHPHGEYYGCNLTQQSKNELEILKSILHGDES